MALSGERISTDTALLAVCADALRILVWQNTADGSRGRNQPESLLELLAGDRDGKRGGFGFAEPEEFTAWRDAMIGGDDNGGA